MTRWTPLDHLLVFSVALLTPWCEVTLAASCPWDEQGLSLWSELTTWDDLQVPQFEKSVTIRKRVLLNVQPPSLTNITVLAGGALVWGDVDGITLNVTYILVHGEFHIGSEACRFQKRATINLYGRIDSVYEVPDVGRKFLAVAAGGVLEIHGQHKMSWTKLAHTIPAAQNVPCGLFYNHQTSPLKLSQELTSGLHVMVWDSDGSVRDFATFKSGRYDELPQFISTLPDGVVVAAAVRKSVGVKSNSLSTSLESLGATLIQAANAKQNYAFIARKGNTSSASEGLRTESYMRLVDTSRELEFRVASLSSDVDFQVMDLEVTHPKITVAHDVSSWNVGDEILVTSTDFDWRQAEVKKIMACGDCHTNQIKLDSPFRYMHYGEITFKVDERAEVALLTRNILIQGQTEDECYYPKLIHKEICDLFQRDMFGGQTKILMNSTAHIEGVELFQMGQQHFQAAYPLHFHMMNNASGLWFRNNSIHHSLARCITIHGTHYAEVSDNMCYLHVGHGYFLEDSVEQNNTLDRNLGVGTQHGTLLLSDRRSEWCGPLKAFCDAISTFWITHPNNIITRNVAAGSDCVGFHYIFSISPLGLSKSQPWIVEVVKNDSMQYYPVKKFADNVGHSNMDAGLFFDSTLSNGEAVKGDITVPENGVLLHDMVYEPRVPPNANGIQVWTELERSTFYKNGQKNVWMKGGNTRLTNSTMADSQMGFAGGTIVPPGSGAEVKYSLFVSDTDNAGEPQTFTDRSISGAPKRHFNHSFSTNPYDSWTGVGFYKGPMFVESCYFRGYRHYWWADDWEQLYGKRPVRPGAALSFRRRNIYSTRPWSHIKDIKFDKCDNVDDTNWVFRGNLSTHGWFDKDGNLADTFVDVDGSVSGQANTQMVIDRSFYTGPECVDHSNWNMLACPYKYCQLDIQGENGVLSKTKKSKYPLILTRDDVPQDKLILAGDVRTDYLLRTQKAYTVHFNETLGTVPTKFVIRAYGIDKGDVIRVALCLPAGNYGFEINGTNPKISPKDPHVMATSLQELDDDVTGRMFFWDSAVGLLYFKFMTNETRQGRALEHCDSKLCPKYSIERKGGGSGPANCSGHNRPFSVDITPPPIPPQPRQCAGPDSSDGLGAVPREEVVTADPFSISTCPQPDPVQGRSTPELRGCFRHKSVWPEMPFFKQDLDKSMTQEWCQNKCYHRNYMFAALTAGDRCSCGDIFGLHGVFVDIDVKCNKPCTGNSSTLCGGRGRLQIYITGLVSKPVPARCGPNNLGEMVGDKCLYLNHQMLTVGQAQRLCVRLGGDLVTIDSEEKQTAVSYYLLENRVVREKVWSGLNHARNPLVWEHRDGTRLGTFSNWKGLHGNDSVKHFVYLSPLDGYKWFQTKDIITAHPLCDVSTTAPYLEECGEKGTGRRLGPSGTCYMVMHDLMSQQAASYTCHIAKGRLATFSDRQSENELANVLYRLGVDQDYWLDKINRVMKWKDSIYSSQKVSNPKEEFAGALCVLDPEDSTNPCPTDWVEYQDSCYLFLGTVAKSYSVGAGLCERANSESHIVRVESQAENDFLASLITPDPSSTSSLLLDLRYSPRNDEFLWGNGDMTVFSNWTTGHGKRNLAAGSCAVLDPETPTSWKNQECKSVSAYLVCEMPACE